MSAQSTGAWANASALRFLLRPGRQACATARRLAPLARCETGYAASAGEDARAKRCTPSAPRNTAPETVPASPQPLPGKENTLRLPDFEQELPVTLSNRSRTTGTERPRHREDKKDANAWQWRNHRRSASNRRTWKRKSGDWRRRRGRKIKRLPGAP